MQLQSKFVQLGYDDNKAKAHVFDSLSICAHKHILSKKLLNCYLSTNGTLFAIIPNWLVLDHMTAYDYSWPSPDGGEYASGERTTERMAAFGAEYLRMTKDAVILCENWGAKRGDIAEEWWSPHQVACYGDHEVYHVLTPENTDLGMIEDAITPSHHWQTGVCSSSSHVLVDDIPNEEFLDEIAQNTRYIFIPAFDGSGYLIWSPMTVEGHRV